MKLLLTWPEKKQSTASRRPRWFSSEMIPEKRAQNSILMTRHHLDLISASDWSYRVGICFNQSAATTTTTTTTTTTIFICTKRAMPIILRSLIVYVISMEYLRLFLRRHFAGKSVVESPNDSAFFSGYY